MVNSAPMAADSVGVAQPADIDHTTTTKIDTSGITYCTNGLSFAQPWYSVNELAGASAGLSFTRVMMYTTKATLRIKPGTTPPISSFDMEIPERLPSSTVSAEGGMSMSTAPIAMIGPVANAGW